MSVTDRWPVVTTGLDATHWVAVALVVVTGCVHLAVGVSGLVSGAAVGLAAAVTLAGLGFFGAVVLVLRDLRRRLLYAAGVPYTAVQVGLWYWLNYGRTGDSLAGVSPVAVIDKTAQVTLVVLLAWLAWREPAG